MQVRQSSKSNVENSKAFLGRYGPIKAHHTDALSTLHELSDVLLRSYKVIEFL